ncbi:MAG: hypothetical protein SGPRY_001030 [Prymnesium sp.]
MYQLARASTKLARAYLVIGCNELALSHARNAEAVLRGSKRVHTASPLLPEVLHALGLALSRSGKQGEATSYFKRALKACEQVHGPAHLQSCVILNAWSKMALDVSKDYALAHRLLQQEIEIRKAQGGDALSGKERDEVLSIVLQRARLILLQAKEIEKEGAKPDTPVEPRVRQLRQSAVELLRSEMVQMEGSGEQGEVNMGSEMEAQLVLHVADACRELGEWEQAEKAMAYSVPFLEERHGMSDPKTVALWLEIAGLRMKLHRYAAAACDFEHCLTMQEVVHGDDSTQLIPTLEKLCKARVLQRQWQPALDALNRAHAISRSRNGATHAESRRIEDVVLNLEQQIRAISTTTQHQN